MKNILVAGLGVSGYEAARLGLSQNLSVTIVDKSESNTLKKLSTEIQNLGATVHLGENALRNISNKNYDAIVLSPGIHPKQEFGLFLSSLNIPVISELEFASRFCQIPLIGITGTNGKTTTVELVTHCLNKIGRKAIAAGNIGYALSRVIREGLDWDFIVVEVSSFQLEAIAQLQFCSGALLNISSDHIDRYDSFIDYAAVKCRLLEHSKRRTLSVSVKEYISELKESDQSVDYSDKHNADFSLQAYRTLVTPDGSFPYEDHSLKGLHNAENLLTCLSLLSSLGFSCNDVYDASLSYKPAEHRLQFFLNEYGIIFINDSKATNPDALRMALESCGNKETRNIVLIAGGRDKKMDFKVVNSALCSYVRKLFIYGECRHTLNDVWKGLVPCEIYENFAGVVKASLNEVKEGDILLLSPGCSSLDSFKNYGDRGKDFMQLVQEWTKK